MQHTLPPEWGKQCAVMLTWPYIDTDWGDQLEDVEAVFIEISLAIVAKQKLIIVCHNHTLKQHVTKRLLQTKIVLNSLNLW